MKQISNVRIKRSGLCLALFAAMLLEPASIARASTFGTFVTIGGQAADLALDEARGVLYVANFGGNRIDVMSLASHHIENSIHVAPYPGSISLSPDGRFLVVAHFGNFLSPGTPQNALTVVDLGSGGKQTFSLGDPPLGVAFGMDAKALLAVQFSVPSQAVQFKLGIIGGVGMSKPEGYRRLLAAEESIHDGSG